LKERIIENRQAESMEEGNVERKNKMTEIKDRQ
jgi:hypothetical protein